MYIWLIPIATFLAIMIGGLFALKNSDKLHLILGFSAGTVIGVALFDLIPESYSLTSGSPYQPYVPLLMGIGFATYMIFDRFLSLHHHSEVDCDNPHHEHGKGLGAATIVIHSFIDGLAIGLSFKVSAAVGLVVAVAVLAHNFSDGINTVSAVLKEENNKKEARRWLVTNALAPAAGVAVSIFITVSEVALGLILSFFVGLFLYLGAADLVPESHHRHPALWTTVMTVLGMAVIYLAVRLAT